MALFADIFARKSEVFTADGGSPERYEAWFIPGITTTGYEYLATAGSREVLFI